MSIQIMKSADQNKMIFHNAGKQDVRKGADKVNGRDIKLNNL